MAQKVAGHLIDGALCLHRDCIYVAGHLLEDKRGTHHYGESRDLSNMPITTSWVEKLEYIEAADTTVITTRNSIYYTNGDLIQRDLDSYQNVIEGKEVLYKYLSDKTKREADKKDPLDD